MVRRYLSILSLFILTLLSCSKEEELNLPAVNEDKVVLLTQIESVASESRADIGIDGKGNFVDGDAISLYVNGSQGAYTLSGGRWLPELSWDDIQGESVPFRGFFPKLNHNNWKFTHTVLPNQNVGNNFENSDLLYADEVMVNRGEKVNLNFRHLMSCITVVLKSDDFTEKQLSEAIVKVRAYNKVEVKANGTVGDIHDYDYKPDRSEMTNVTFKYKGNGTFQAVMCPQSKLHYWSYDGSWMSISINGKTHLVPEPPGYLSDGTSFNAYKSGENVTLTYHIKDVDFANRTVWVDGLKGIPDSSTDAWILDKDTKLKSLPWKAEYGWYDCSKKNTLSSEYKDMNKCWAATASNMIHWWMDRNKPYIDRFCELKGSTLEELKIPHKYKDHHETEVFQLFRDRFEDKGGYPKHGLNWFFGGNYIRENDAAQLYNSLSTDGYFKEVFGSNPNMVEHVGIVDMKSLTATLKKAFKNKQAIGFSILLQGFGSAHAMTIWGAKFDKNGDACAIYYVDNNDGPLGETPVGLIEARVGEYEGTTYPEYKGKACMENSYGKTEIYIQDIDLLNLKQNEWDAYFSRHSK